MNSIYAIACSVFGGDVTKSRANEVSFSGVASFRVGVAGIHHRSPLHWSLTRTRLPVLTALCNNCLKILEFEKCDL